MVNVPDMLPLSGHSWGRGGSQSGGIHCKTLLVSRQHCWRVLPGASAGGSQGWGGRGMGKPWLHRVLCMGGNLYRRPRLQLPHREWVQGALFRPNTRSVPAVFTPQHLGVPAWESPRKVELAQGEGKIPMPTLCPGREAPSCQGTCAAGGGEAQRKSRERSRFWAWWQESSAGGRSRN